MDAPGKVPEPVEDSKTCPSTTELTTKIHFEYLNLGGIDEDLLCAVCHDPLLDPVVAPECEHLFCRECLVSWFARSPEGQLPFTCPQCRAPVEGISSVDEARTKLKKAHRIICNKVDALLVLCPVCFARNERQHQRAHELRCPVDCDQGCQAKVAPADREAHLEVCEGTIVPCEAADAGCSWSGPRKELTAHTGSCPTVPMRGILLRLNALEKENARIKQLEEKLETLSNYVSPPTETCKKCKATRTWSWEAPP